MPTSEEIARAYGERLVCFREMKRRLDPEGVLTSDLARRLLTEGPEEPAVRTAAVAQAAGGA